MPKCAVLPKHGALSPDRSVPTYPSMAARRDPRREIGAARTCPEPVSPTLRGIGATLCSSALVGTTRVTLCSAHSLPPAATAKDAGDSRRHPPGTGRTAAGALHRRRFALDGPHHPGVAEPRAPPDPNSL